MSEKQPKSIVISVSLPTELAEWAKDYAWQNKLSFSGLIQELLYDGYEEECSKYKNKGD